ncbi:hypothetical protein DQ812_03350 [Salmonella enterica subsp. enterica]|nr:hypothetical protein [Salmonella enterica subsp. enterica]EAT9996030.1 hypothetical protein [Salmonella enterica]EBS4934181.1 hypothetical protein [Salmonella enterica subsp. enterica serovar Goverdhan]EBU7058536.1 hypothetical protein [Salmonella enterica subsp. enterica serovar Goverdhan]MLO35996.1 hypothetical protein [Salmonella enterica subsp. enterica serovar Goverdhan]
MFRSRTPSHLHFILRATSLLAALENPSHIVIYAPGDFLAYRRDASRMMLRIVIVKTSSEQTSTQRPQVMQSR